MIMNNTPDNKTTYGGHYNVESLDSLFQVCQRHAESPPQEVLNLYEEVGIARHVVQQNLNLYMHACKREEQVQAAVSNYTNPPSGQDPEPVPQSLMIELKKAKEYKSLITDQLKETLQFSTATTKRAAEVDSLLINQFSGLQVLTLLAQMQRCLGEFMREMLTHKGITLEEEEVVTLTADFKKYFEDNLNLSEFNSSSSSSSNAVDINEARDQVAAMLASVPTSPSTEGQN